MIPARLVHAALAMALAVVPLLSVAEERVDAAPLTFEQATPVFAKLMSLPAADASTREAREAFNEARDAATEAYGHASRYHSEENRAAASLANAQKAATAARMTASELDAIAQTLEAVSQQALQAADRAKAAAAKSPDDKLKSSERKRSAADAKRAVAAAKKARGFAAEALFISDSASTHERIARERLDTAKTKTTLALRSLDSRILKLYQLVKLPSEDPKEQEKDPPKTPNTTKSAPAGCTTAVEQEERKSVCADYCSTQDTLCIDLAGRDPLCGGVDMIAAGSSLTVRVITRHDCTGTIGLAVGTIARTDRLVAAPLSAEAQAPKYKVAQESVFQVPTDENVAALQVRVTFDSEPVFAQNVVVDHGRYYVRAGVLFTIVPNGVREVHQQPQPSGETTLGIEREAHAGVALALNIYPFGRQAGEISPFRHNANWQAFRQTIGVQVGVGLDFTEVDDELYAGVLFEPITGVALSTGLALVENQYLPPGFPPSASVSPGRSPPPAREVKTLRPYLGLSVTTGLLTTLTGLRSDVLRVPPGNGS